MDRSLAESNLDQTPNTIVPKRSLLIIDDSLDVLLVLRLSLEVEGFEVFTAETGAEAFEILAKGIKPNLILLDMQIGDMTGTEFLTLLEKKSPELINEIPTVFYSGMADVPTSRAVVFIRKPADRKTLVIALNNYIEMGTRLSF
jgi:CheY-like chemotaxis protein